MSRAWRWVRMAVLLAGAVLSMVVAIMWFNQRHYVAALIATSFAGVLSQRTVEVFYE